MMVLKCSIFLALLVLGTEALVPRKLGVINTVNPGFSNFFEHADPSIATEKYSLIFSSFVAVPLITDYTRNIRHVGKFLGDLNSTVITELSDRPTWPREPSQVPNEVFGYEAVCQPDGFLVPGKTDGSVKVIDVRDWNNPITHDITSNPAGNDVEYFYHRAIWKDVNDDGRMDALTNRANVALPSKETNSALVWYEHPDTENPLEVQWVPHVIHNNLSDTFLTSTTLQAGGKSFETILTVGCFSNKLLIHWSTATDGSWANPNDITWREIDTGCRFFYVEVLDLNRDDRLDVLVTCNAEKNGSLIAYEIPDDFRTGEYAKHILAYGFDVINPSQGAGAPGAARPVQPNINSPNRKPLLALSGDDSGFAYILTANSEDPADWTYQRETILNEGDENIVGTISVADVDGDGYTELFAPSYYLDKFHVFSFSPAP